MKKVTTVSAALGLLGLGASAFAQFTGGNLVVSVVKSGDGATPITNSANLRILREFKTDGSTTGTSPDVVFPTVVNGANRRLTDSGTATSNGFINLSTDGRYILAAGYDAALGTATVTSSASATVNRVIGRYEWSKTAALGLDTSTALTDAYSANNFRNVVSVDGTAYWTSGTGTNPGVRYVTHGTVGTSTQLSTTVTNIRNIKIYNGQLYVSTASGAFNGINQVGTGLPTTSGQTITRFIDSTNNAATTGSPYDFVFDGDNIVYVADDNVSASAFNNGGLQKWVKNDNGVWVNTVTYIIPQSDGVTRASLRGLALGSSNVLYAVTAEVAASVTNPPVNRLVRLTLTGNTPNDVTVTTLATAAADEYFRDVEILPVSGFTVGGTIAFQTGLENVPRNQPLFLTFTPTGSTGGGIINQTVTPAANGNYTSTTIPNGTYRLRAKTTYSLSTAADVTVNNGNVSGVNFILKGGDSNNDNAVDVTDLLAVINAYNQQKNNPPNNPNYKEGADFNADGANDVADLLLVISNYNQLGAN